MAIRNPLEWGWDAVRGSVVVAAPAVAQEPLAEHRIAIRRIGVDDLGQSLRAGMADFGAGRTDVVFLCITYPVIGLLLARLAVGQGILPLLFPLAAGFTLLGPLFAVGLNEMSRQREQNGATRWNDAFGVLHAASPGAILQLGIVLMAIFGAWIAVAAAIYAMTFGMVSPASVGDFVHDVFTTGAGWGLILLGMGAGFVFAVLVLSITVVSFPLLLDRPATAAMAMRTSWRLVAANPATAAIWGLIVAAGLVLGSIPFFIGLIFVLPVLGHATWHLYRRAVVVT